MSDAAPIAREWLHERSLSLDRTDDLAAMLKAYAAEQTAALRYQIAQQDESIERLYEERNAWKTEAQEGRKQTAAMRAALNVLLQPDVTRCASERCGECAACHARAVLAAPEATP